jgi:hypothetical protein
MANIRLYPPYGTREQSSSVKFEIYDISDIDDIKIEIENATDNVKIEVKSLQKLEDMYAGVMDLNIPEHSSQSSISIFANIYSVQSDGTYKILQICPAIFEIQPEEEVKDGDISISPNFIGQDDLCRILVKGEPLSDFTLSVNDKILRVIVNQTGFGTIHFKGSEVIGKKELESINKIPVYVYRGENKTDKVFSGSYINILPTNIAIHADIDPRCDIDSTYYVTPGTWVRPEECEDTPCDPKVEDCNECNPLEEDCDLPYVCSQVIDIPTRVCESGTVQLGDEHCRIHNNSMVSLNNGMVMYAYTSPDNTYETSPDDDRYNVNRVFISAWYTSPIVDVLVNRDVVVASKTAEENFRIYVEEDVWDAVNNVGDLRVSANAIYIVFYNSAFGYQKARIDSLEIDEYTGGYVLVALAGGTNVALDSWIFCVNSVIYNYQDTPQLYINGVDDHMPLPFVREDFEDGAYAQPVNVSIATNDKYIGNDRETYVYFVVEAITGNNVSQLYFNSLVFGKDSIFDQKTYGWTRLTDSTQGNNRNPVAKMDSYNNLHVVFESDRGGINQLYYGNIGLNYILPSATVFSSSIDKYSEFLSTGEVPFDYFQPLLLKAATDQPYFPIPEYDTQSVLSEKWNTLQSGGGSVSLTDMGYYLDDLTIVANPLSQEAMAITSLKILDADADGEVDPSLKALTLLQYNYQISFDLEAVITQNNNLTTDATVTKIEMDNLFKNWKSTFTVAVDTIVTSNPTYIGSDNNKFIIGRSDNIYDRIVPLVGSYGYTNTTNPSNIDSQIKILKTDNNLKDFTFGLMFEKTYFKASNVQTSSDYVADGNQISTYIAEELETIYTGKAKLVAFIKTTDNSDTRANYIIVREFPEALDVNTSAIYDILVNYTRVSSDQTENVLNTYETIYENKFVGTLTLIIDGIPKFSQSFVTAIDFEYNYFDIGFGMPTGGYYVADKMSPSKLGVFDSVTANLSISGITISSPTYTYNDAVVSLPPTVRDITNFKVFDESFSVPSNTIPYAPSDWSDNLITLNFVSKDEIKYYTTYTESAGEDYEELFSVENVEKISIEFLPGALTDNLIVTSEYGTILYETGFVSTFDNIPIKFDVDVTLIDNVYISIDIGPDSNNLSYSFSAYFKKVHNDNTFIQTPITFEGINQSAALDIGLCDDVNIVWQSNRNKYWNIYYANSVDELSPFRYETQITNTESNSIRPSISVNRTGKRLIAWNDNRNGEFAIYAARSLNGYDCTQKSCENKMLQNYEDQVEQCDLSFIVTPSTTGIYNLILYFYSDIGSGNLYKAMYLEDNPSRWLINSVRADGLIVYDDSGNFLGVSLIENTEYSISYAPDKNDMIFDMVLYAKLDSVLVEEGV